MRRFHVTAAYALGVLMPALEIARRRTRFDNVPAYVDDLVIGALLLWGAWASSRRTYGPSLLVAAWGILCGGMWSSFFGQLHNVATTDVSGLANGTVVAVKGAIYAIALVGLWCSVRSATAKEPR